MIKIRLARHGAKGNPFYRIVAIDSRLKREGKPKEVIGFYNPIKKELKLEKKKLEAWVKRGARISQSLAGLIDKSK